MVTLACWSSGADRSDFPRQTERLVIDVAANQVCRCVCNRSRKLTEQRRVARELDERVAQRTSELSAANERLERSESESRLIVDSIPGLIAILSPTGALETVNRQLFEYFGQTLEQLKAWGTNDTVLSRGPASCYRRLFTINPRRHSL